MCKCGNDQIADLIKRIEVLEKKENDRETRYNLLQEMYRQFTPLYVDLLTRDFGNGRTKIYLSKEEKEKLLQDLQ
jgi:hypothetical protein